MSLTVLVRRCALVVVLGMAPAYAQAQSVVTSVAQDAETHSLTILGAGSAPGSACFLRQPSRSSR